MRKRSLLFIIAMACLSLTIHSQAQTLNSLTRQRPVEKKSLRIFIEDNSSAALQLMEALRDKADEYGFRFTFTNTSSEPFEVRIVVTSGSGQTWDQNPNQPPDALRFPVTNFYSSVVAFTTQGRTLFIVSQSANTLHLALAAIARETIKKFYSHYATLKAQQQGTVEIKPPAVAAVEAASDDSRALQGLPTELGVYYQAANAWVKLQETVVANMQAKGVGKALLSFGLSGIGMTQVYSGAHSALQIVEPTPTFYVRGIAVSTRETAFFRLAKKTRHRELLVGSTSAVQAQVGYRAQDICEVIVTQVTDDVIAIRPRAALPSGEYLLSFTKTEITDSGYDFGVALNKK